MLKQNLQSNLKKARKAKNLSQEQVAAHLNMKRQTYSAYETGVSTPDPQTLYDLSVLFELSIDELVAAPNDLVRNKDFEKNILKSNIIDLSELSEESKKDLLKQLELLKMRDNLKKYKDETSSELRPRLN